MNEIENLNDEVEFKTFLGTWLKTEKEAEIIKAKVYGKDI